MLPTYRTLFQEGARIGFQHFSRQGVAAAGLKRSLGFILQPIENWSRYPELALALNHLHKLPDDAHILDIGSPKMLGLLLTKNRRVNVTATDIWPAAVKEVEHLVACQRQHMAGQLHLGVADGRKLPYGTASFDAIYMISVLEHVAADRAARLEVLSECARVLKPTGQLIVSVPVCPKSFDQYMKHSVYGRSSATAPQQFFQHLYDRDDIEAEFYNHPQFSVVQADLSQWHEEWAVLKLWRKVPQSLRGLLGIVNLALAPYASRIEPVNNNQFTSYGDVVLNLRRR